MYVCLLSVRDCGEIAKRPQIETAGGTRPACLRGRRRACVSGVHPEKRWCRAVPGPNERRTGSVTLDLVGSKLFLYRPRADVLRIMQTRTVGFTRNEWKACFVPSAGGRRGKSFLAPSFSWGRVLCPVEAISSDLVAEKWQSLRFLWWRV